MSQDFSHKKARWWNSGLFDYGASKTMNDTSIQQSDVGCNMHPALYNSQWDTEDLLENGRAIIEDALHDDYPYVTQKALTSLLILINRCDVFFLNAAVTALDKFPRIKNFRQDELSWCLETALPEEFPVIRPSEFDYHLLDDVWKCNHDAYTLTRRSIKTGIRKALQCCFCGKMLSIQFTAEQRKAPINDLPDFDDAHKERQRKEWMAWRSLFQSSLWETKSKWFERWHDLYHEYLASYEWKEKRQQVLDRAQGKCEKCGKVAGEVHHLSYRQVFNEPLSDLIALCYWCHHAEHGTAPSVPLP